MADELTPLATADDLAAITGETYGDDTSRVTALLTEATAMLVGYGLDPDSLSGWKAELAKDVACNMVARVLASSDQSGAIQQASKTAGPYTVSFTNAMAGESMYVTRAERKMLGLGGGSRVLDPWGVPDAS